MERMPVAVQDRNGRTVRMLLCTPEQFNQLEDSLPRGWHAEPDPR
jgi:hypothetical protein